MMKQKFKYRWFNVQSIIVFIGITLCFHFFFRQWASTWSYYPIKEVINHCYNFLAHQVYVESKSIISMIFEVNGNNESQQIIFTGGGYIGISAGCSGLKQMLQCITVFLFARGSPRHKLWFIPFGVLMMHLNNLIRIIGLSFFVVYRPEYWNLAHDYFFRPLFYMVIFGLWVWWEERFNQSASL